MYTQFQSVSEILVKKRHIYLKSAWIHIAEQSIRKKKPFFISSKYFGFNQDVNYLTEILLRIFPASLSRFIDIRSNQETVV